MFHDTLPTRHGAIDRAEAPVSRWLRGAFAAYRRHRTVARLADLSDHTLRDIGLTRDEARLYGRTGGLPR